MTPLVSPHGIKRGKDDWRRFKTHEDFVRDHREPFQRMQRYLERGYRNYQKLTSDQERELKQDAWKYWLANNAESRIALAALAVQHFGVLESQLPKSACINMVTLIPDRYAVALSDAPQFDPASLMAWTRQELRGFDFIAMVEPGFYGNVGRYMNGRPDHMVSWHVHALVWGADQGLLQYRMAHINGRYDALLPGVDVALALEDQRDTWQARLRYLLKGVLWEYRIWPIKKRRPDKDGREEVRPTGRFRQKDRPIRPGNAVRMVRVMEGRTLDKLMFGSPSAKALLACIKRDMARSIPKRHRSRAEQALVDRPAPPL